jgi:hypothetical protein
LDTRDRQHRNRLPDESKPNTYEHCNSNRIPYSDTKRNAESYSIAAVASYTGAAADTVALVWSVDV